MFMSPIIRPGTHKKPRASEKFLIEIQIELDNQIREFFSERDISVHST